MSADKKEALKTKFRGKLSSRSPLGELPKGGLHPLWRSLCSLLPPLLRKGAFRRPLSNPPLEPDRLKIPVKLGVSQRNCPPGLRYGTLSWVGEYYSTPKTSKKHNIQGSGFDRKFFIRYNLLKFKTLKVLR